MEDCGCFCLLIFFRRPIIFRLFLLFFLGSSAAEEVLDEEQKVQGDGSPRSWIESAGVVSGEEEG